MGAAADAITRDFVRDLPSLSHSELQTLHEGEGKRKGEGRSDGVLQRDEDATLLRRGMLEPLDLAAVVFDLQGAMREGSGSKQGSG